MKLFIAVPIEHEEDFSFLASCSENLKNHAVSGSFVRLANFHVTLVYIGETDRVTDIEDVMDEAAEGFGPFRLVLDRTGTFSRGRSRTVWVGGASNRLSELYDALWSGLDKAGFDIERRSYRPHITLARKVVFESRRAYSKHSTVGKALPRDKACHDTGTYYGRGGHYGSDMRRDGNGVRHDGRRHHESGMCHAGSMHRNSNMCHDNNRKLALENPPHILPVERIVLFSSEIADAKRFYREIYSVALGTG